MTPIQRTDAERLADEYAWKDVRVAALLRDLVAEPEGELVAWICKTGHGIGARSDRPPEDIIQFWTPVYTRPQRPEPQGEPVARIHVWSKISRFTGQPECHAELVNFEDGVEKLPEGEHVLYAHPPTAAPAA